MPRVVRLLLTAVLVVGVLLGAARATCIRWWKIPKDDPYLEASIAPTLWGGDWVVLWRLTAPKFGDLVLCPEPEQDGRLVIGRIAGLAGDQVEIRGSQVLVNRRRATGQGSCLNPEFTVSHPATGEAITQRCDWEELGSRTHQRGNVAGSQPPANSKTEVGSEQVFLLSDNRLFPYDSREFGPVDRETCTESFVFRLLGADGFKDVEARFSLIH